MTTVTHQGRARMAARCVALVALLASRGRLPAADARRALGLRDRRALDTVLARMTYGVTSLQEDDDGGLWLEDDDELLTQIQTMAAAFGWLSASRSPDEDDETREDDDGLL